MGADLGFVLIGACILVVGAGGLAMVELWFEHRDALLPSAHHARVFAASMRIAAVHRQQQARQVNLRG